MFYHMDLVNKSLIKVSQRAKLGSTLEKVRQVDYFEEHASGRRVLCWLIVTD